MQRTLGSPLLPSFLRFRTPRFLSLSLYLLTLCNPCSRLQPLALSPCPDLPSEFKICMF